jgi:DNA topoisomerase IA
MGYRLVITEKPSVASAIAKVIGAKERKDGYFQGGGYLVSWCVGHLVELAMPQAYDEKYGKWRKEDLPILPEKWKYQIYQSFIRSGEMRMAVYTARKRVCARRITRIRPSLTPVSGAAGLSGTR